MKHNIKIENELTLKTLQAEHRIWSTEQFGYHYPDTDGDDFWKPVFGVMEELGELTHSLLKQSQGIRGSSEEHEAKAKDAIGDMTIFIASICSMRGWDYQEIVEKTWAEVKQRNYKKGTLKGKE